MSRTKLSRRAFLQTAAASATVATLTPVLAQTPPLGNALPYPENGTLIPDEGWHLWVDEHAEWKNDAIYLPEDVDIAKLPVNAPTGGWDALSPTQAGTIPVTLPGTVEQHLWGKFGQRP